MTTDFEEVRGRSKRLLGLTHTNGQDAHLDLYINDAMSKFNNIIRFIPARCCVDVFNGNGNVPEGFYSMIAAEVEGLEYSYVNKNFFTSFDLQCTDQTQVDTNQTVKVINNQLNFGALISGTATVYYNKYNKVDGRYVIDEELSIACSMYACYMYSLQTGNPRMEHFNQLWIANQGVANRRSQEREMKQDYNEIRAIMNDMFSTSRYFRVGTTVANIVY